MTIKKYAFIKDNNVINIVLFDNPSEETLSHFKNELNIDLIIEDNGSALVGGTHDGLRFWKPQPYPSWIKDEDLEDWKAPVEYPEIDQENPKYYQWNESILNWEEIQVSE